MDNRHRVTVLLTHAVQYFSPWFQFIQEHAPAIDLRVLYAVKPSSTAQGAGFGTPFQWDRDLLEGYSNRVLHAEGTGHLGADRFSSIDAPNLEEALLAERPDVVLVPGWHSAFYRRAMRIAANHRIPALYRGDSNLFSGPSSPIRRAWWRARTRARLGEYSGFLSVGTRSREYLQAFGAPEPLIFDSPHAVDNESFARASLSGNTERRRLRERFGLNADAFTFSFVGKLEPKKRPLDAIRAVASMSNVQLLVVGAGALEEACRAEASRVGARVTFAGFLNQADLHDVYAVSDGIVVPSDGGETWGLVVNEAMAAGVPAVVSDRVGCQPDLMVEGETGFSFPLGELGALTAALERLRVLRSNGHDFTSRCQAQANRHSFAAATDGLVAACDRLTYQIRAEARKRDRPTQVLALCGHMVTAGGLERMTFEVLATLRRNGAGVHCLVNRWGSSRIVALAERAGVAWSIGRSDEPLRRRPASVAAAARMVWEVVRSSIDVVTARQRGRATHILVPDFLVTVRVWPALALLRLSGCRIILRVGMAPPEGRFYRALWRRVVNTVVDRMITNSEYLNREVRRLNVPERKLGLIRNAAVRRGESRRVRQPYAIVYVGQVIPDKGVDVLIDAVAELRRQGVPATLDVIGDVSGWESPTYSGHHDRLRALAGQSEVDGAIRFLGNREDVGALMAGAAVHCCPSRLAIREGMANVVLEAKAAGVPSVVTRSGSLPELVEHGIDGWIADDAPGPLAEGLRYFLEDPERRDRAGQAARDSLRRFSREVFDNAWLREFNLAAVPVPVDGVPATAGEAQR